jgi:hypothetical protein
MNKINRKIVAVVTTLTVWASIAAPTFALTADELQAQINALLAQLNTLQSQLAGMTGGTTGTIAGCTITSFDRALKLAMTGDDVKCLQIVLNSSADTQLASSGVGSSGNETSYFGPLTQSAVIKFQEKYASDILASWGLTSGTGYVGATTRAKLNELLAAGGTGGTGTGGTTPAQAGLTVGLAADTYPQTGIPYGTAIPFLKFTLLSSEEVSITSIKVSAGGLGTYTNVQEVAIFDEAGVRLSTRKNINSDGYALFNFSTPLVIAANTLKTLTVQATVDVGGVGQAFYLAIMADADIISNASEMHGLPVMGNALNVLAAGVGSSEIDAAATTNNTYSFGEDDVLAAQFDVPATGDDLLFSRIRFKNGGTGDDDLISNLRLICDGEELGTAELVSDYVDFSFSPLEIEQGDTAVCEVRGDLGTGSTGDTIKLYIKDVSDVTMICKTNGFLATVTTPDFSAAADAQILTMAAGDFTIDFDKSADTGTPSQEKRPGTKNVVIATLKMTSNAENATIESIADGGLGTNQFEIGGTGWATATDITAVELRDVDTGGVYDIASTFVTNLWNLSLTEEISLVAGVTKTFELRVDIDDTVEDGDELQVILDAGAITVTGDVSGETILDITPSSITSAKTTIDISSLTVTTKALTNAAVVGGAQDIVIYQGTFKAGDSSLATLKTVTISEVSTDSNASQKLFSDDNITVLKAYLGGQLMKTESGKISEAAAVDSGTGDITFSSLSANNVIPAGESKDFVLKASFSSTLNGAGTFALGITDATADVIARDVDSELIVEDITSTSAESRTVTLATVGDLKVQLKTTDLKANKDMFIVGGSSGPSGRYLGELVFTTENEPVKVKTIRLDEQNGTTGNDTVASVSLVEADGTVVATKIAETDADVNFENVNLEFPADEATSYFIMANINGINVSGDPTSVATSGDAIQYNVANVVAEGVNSGESITMVSDADGTLAFGEWSSSTAVFSKTGTSMKAAITNITNKLSDGVLSNGAGKIIGKYEVTVASGNNRNVDNTDAKAVLGNLVVTINTGGAAAATGTSVQAYIEGDSSNKTTPVTGSGTATINMATILGNANQVDGTFTIVIIATVYTDGDGDSLQTELHDLSSDVTYTDGTTSNSGDCKLTISDVYGGTLSN